MKPLIGITASLLQESNREWLWNTSDYFRAVQRAGGIPVLLPFCQSEDEAAEILDRIDGLLLSGGGDMDSLLYGEEPHPKNGTISPERDVTELAMTAVALRRQMTILGICRGHQVLAVAAGGTLVQDIPAQVPGAIKHRQEAPRWYPTHTVKAAEGSRLAALLGADFKVNSYHHQSIKAVPPGWVTSAVAPDGVIEAIEHPEAKFMLAVQWHPENMAGQSDQFAALFEAFIAASRS